jgi:hypothetical protein
MDTLSDIEQRKNNLKTLAKLKDLETDNRYKQTRRRRLITLKARKDFLEQNFKKHTYGRAAENWRRSEYEALCWAIKELAEIYLPDFQQ